MSWNEFGSHSPYPGRSVCGGQSVGKGFVLEAISGMSFAMKDSICKWFPTELVHRRDDRFVVKVSISPGRERSADERGGSLSLNRAQ